MFLVGVLGEDMTIRSALLMGPMPFIFVTSLIAEG
jgi:hypothetical protein